MNRLAALALVIVLWAAIYLPGLGSTELKGEEGRRALPAITMLETGNWIVPFIGGKPFLRKPPLVNWLIAASFKLHGVRNEWAARLPSALCVLAMGCVFVILSGREDGRFLSPQAGLVAAIMSMTSFGLLAKARFAGAEIEGIYVPLCGIAMVTWIVWWAERRSPWLVWTVPLALLGLASLAKSPLHLLFFYAIVVAVLWKARGLRELWSAPHALGVLLMIGIFAAWAVPYFRLTTDAGQVWKDQFAGRVTENVFSWSSWLLNLPRGLFDQLPWLLFVGTVWRRRNDGLARDQMVISGTFLAICLCFVGLLLVPGVLTRYVLPLGIPLALLTARAVCTTRVGQERELLNWHRINVALALLLMCLAFVAPVAAGAKTDASGMAAALQDFNFSAATRAALVSAFALAVGVVVVSRRARGLQPAALAVTTGALLGAAAFLYATAAVRWITRGDDLRPLATRIDDRVPPGKRLVLYDPGYQPVIFYLQTPYLYATETDEIPAGSEFILVRESKARDKLQRRWFGAEIMEQWTEKDGKKCLLLRLPRASAMARATLR